MTRKDYAREYMRRKAEKRRVLGLCIKCGKEETRSNKQSCQNCADKISYSYKQKLQTDWFNTHDKKAWRKLRQTVLELLGNMCAVCKHNDPEVLDLDHKKNDGADKRRINTKTYRGSNNSKAYREVLHNPQTTVFQLLCRNCNWKKHLRYMESRRNGD